MCLSVFQILIGNAYYNCSCVRYVITDSPWLVIGLSIGCSLILVIVIFIIILVVACRSRRSNPTEERGDCHDNVAGSIELDEEEDKYYCTIPAAEVASGNTYSKPGPVIPDNNKEYSALGAPEPPPTRATTDDSPYYLTLQDDDTC